MYIQIQRLKERELMSDRDEMATNLAMREERRRRIAEKGSDRMALITGQIQSLPPSPPPSPQQPRPPPINGTDHLLFLAVPFC